MNNFNKNKQYLDFVLSQILRPYSGSIPGLARPTKIVMERSDENLSKGIVWHKNIWHWHNTYPEWWKSVLDRAARANPEIDFSFFPNDSVAFFIQYSLRELGVKQVGFSTPVDLFEDMEDDEDQTEYLLPEERMMQDMEDQGVPEDMQREYYRDEFGR